MSSHVNGHRMHAHSLQSYRSLDTSSRRALILSLLETARRPVTDRELLAELVARGHLPSEDPNLVRPRLTEMVQDGTIRECAPRRCRVTGKTVRTLWLVSPYRSAAQASRSEGISQEPDSYDQTAMGMEDAG